MLKLIFSNYCDVGNLLYQKGWKQWLFFDTVLSRPKYEIVTKYDTSGLTIVYRRVEKRVNFDTGAVAEFVMDALNILPLMDYVVIYSDGNYYKCTNIAIENQKLTDCLFNCNIQFTINQWRYDNCCRDIATEILQDKKVGLGCEGIFIQAGNDEYFFADNEF